MKTLKAGILTLALLTTITLGQASVSAWTLQFANPQDVECLAQNIYHEARGEPLEGQIAVAQVTVNRVKSGKFQSSVCATVYAYRQFSWTLDKNKRIRDLKAWQASVNIARAVLTQSVQLPNFKALFFHTRQVNPRWNRAKHVVGMIGNHIFYS